ncbi:hypothetical protein CITSP_00008 [Citrobacter sp. T1.2D-1]|nr:hypothetical protein CITSP_00008 [Citrobacter sp. T1.2D-1]
MVMYWIWYIYMLNTSSLKANQYGYVMEVY